jgi:hypothetical protein
MTPDIWVYVLPALFSGIWGTEAYFDPGQTLTIGPAPSEVVGGLGGVVKDNNDREDGAGAATLAYAGGWKFLNLQPKLTVFATQRGDVVAGLGVQDEFLFKNLSLLPDGSAPLFPSWSAGPALYLPGRGPEANYGHTLQFQMVDEVGFYVGHSMRVSLAYDHYSDGGFTNINPNGNAITLNLGYRF